MKIFGHPLHIMLIHFPSALFPMDLICSIINYKHPDPGILAASFYAMAGGVILGYVAMIIGAFDLINIYEKKPNAMKTALLHGSINASVIIAYSILFFLQCKHYPLLNADGINTLVIKSVIIIFMIAGNFLGGKLILKYKVAVE